MWLAGMAGVFAFLGITAIEHVLRPELSPATHQISEYANGQHGALMTIAFVLWAVSLACTAGLAFLMERGRPIAAVLLVAALGIAVTAAFHTQTSAGVLRPGEVLHAAGRLHDIGSGVATLALAAAMVLSLRVNNRRLRRATAVVLVVVPVDAVMLAIGSDVGGVRQRVLVVTACAWQLTMLTLVRACGLCERPAEDSRIDIPLKQASEAITGDRR